MQRALTPYADAIEALGVPAARPRALPALFDRLVAENAVLTREDRAALEALRPRVVDRCEELAVAPPLRAAPLTPARRRTRGHPVKDER